MKAENIAKAWTGLVLVGLCIAATLTNKWLAIGKIFGFIFLGVAVTALYFFTAWAVGVTTISLDKSWQERKRNRHSR